MPTADDPCDPAGLDRAQPDRALRDWLSAEVGEVGEAKVLMGGLSSQMIRLRRSDGSGDIVVRRWSGEHDWEPGMVAREVAGLTALATTDLPAPRLLAADLDGSASGRPTTVTTCVSGEVELAPRDPRDWVRQLAGMLVRIHDTALDDITPTTELDPCDVWSRDERDWLADPGVIAAASTLAARPPDSADHVLSHGDYQHFNILWHEQHLAHVVDWPAVGVGSRGLDVGHCRLNLAVLFSAELAMQFLDDYETLAGVRVDPASDVQQLLCFGADWQKFIPIQVAGRTPVDGAGMAGRVRETVLRTLRRAG